MSDTPIRDTIMKDQEKYTTCKNVNCKAHTLPNWLSPMEIWDESYNIPRHRPLNGSIYHRNDKQLFDCVERYVIYCGQCMQGEFYGERERNGPKRHHYNDFNITKGNL